MRRLAATLALLGLMLAAPRAGRPAEGEPVLRVYTARTILTLDPSLPEASAVAVRDGRIVSVGSLDSLRPWLDAGPHEIDRRFEDKVLVPGFVDNHLHPIMAAVLLPMEFATPFDWHLEGRTVAGVQGRDAYLDRLRQLERSRPDATTPLFAWGYHPLFHGPLARSDLDAISSTRPIVAWHRSFHEIIVNTPALRWLGIEPEDVAGRATVDYERGHFFETGLEVAFRALLPHLLAPERLGQGLERMRDAVHRGGITTLADMATGLFDLELEWGALRGGLDSERTPFRVFLVPDARGLGLRQGHAKALETIERLPERNTHRLRFLRAVKLFADGAFYSQLMQLGPPGYIDGHQGEWLMEPAQLEEAARLYWEAGYQIHVHANGDRGIDVTLDVLQRLLEAHPRFDHRFALHHYGFSTTAQARRAAALGAVVSANVYYLYTLGEKYAQVGLGSDRAAQIARVGTAVRAGVPVSFHSDFTMAPAEPLLFVWTAVVRRSAAGNLLAPSERLTVQQALRAVTIDAAHAIGLDAEIGSIAAGKRADFAVLEQNPLAVEPERLREIAVWGTVFEGEPYPVAP